MPEFPIPSPDRAAKIPCLARARACRIARLAQGSSESSSPAFATTSPSSCARPSQTAAPAGITSVLFILLLAVEETITSRFPIFRGLGFCRRKNFRSQLRGNFSIIPPNRLRIFSSSEQFGLATSAIAFLCPGLETIASRRPAISCNATSLEASQPGAGPLSPNEHQPNTRKLFLFRSFGFLLRRYFLR